MADQMKPTPRSPILGLFSDIVNLPLQYMSEPQRTQQMQGVAQFLYDTGIPKTLERASYGEPLFSGAGMTLRPKEETINAAMNVAPFAPAMGRVAGRTGRAVGRMAGEEISAAMSGLPTRSLLGEITPKPKLLDVYHGTPHTLPPTPRNPLGEFDASKIGTGEGAQAYGYGIYTAENPAVAGSYTRTLQGSAATKPDWAYLEIGGKSLDEQTSGMPPSVIGYVAKALKDANGDVNKAIKQFSLDSIGNETNPVVKNVLSVLNKGKDSKVDLSAIPSGNLYKVDLPDEKIATMLDWDKPLSQQSPQVKEALKGIEQDLPSIPDFDLKKWMDADPLASTWHNVLVRDLKVEPSKIAELLQKQGVAGIRYLDEGSRATTGKQTFNFVVFPNEEKSMTILERNGVRAFPQEVSYPQQAALDLAQQRAAQSGQSLEAYPRSLQQGYEHGWYHGTTGDITNFRPDLLGETTGAESAKKGFFFARDPQNPPASMMEKTRDPASIDLFRQLGIPEEEIAKLNQVSMQGHGAETASGYAKIGGTREYKEAMRKANAAEKRGDWSEYEKQMQIAEDSEVKRMNYAQSVVAKYGDARDEMLDTIQKTIYNKNLPQAEAEVLDAKVKQLMPYGWYNSYSQPQLEALKKEIVNLVGEDAASPVLRQIDNFKSIKAERQLVEHSQEGGNVMPVALRYKNPMVYDFGGSAYRDQTYSDLVDQALRGGHDALILKNTFDPAGSPSELIDVGVVFNPDQIRSRFAAFDPFRKDVATATAMGVALPDLLAQPVNQYRPTYEPIPTYTDPFGNTIDFSIR